jgi:2-keto-4-pentenoate hydratase/2-oxohepta-3-ene-1,7-dioic acid hydratase in catechol pathway
VSVERFFRVPAGDTGAWARQEGESLQLLDGEPWARPRGRGESLPLAEAILLAPAAPSKIVAVGRNYADHAAERGKAVPKEPLLFLKPPSALIGPGEPIRRPSWVGRVDHEAELGVVIGRPAARLAGPEEALACVFGATASTMSPPASSRRGTGSSPGPRASTPSVRSAPAWRAGWTSSGCVSSGG